ncbi:hypothetical protein T484DRAFT_3643081 [Baffinella frigidus]|nr:hypothetical protein T484DRAFT_3643081 [Cryptophyta sp. CCMP2293]
MNEPQTERRHSLQHPVRPRRVSWNTLVDVRIIPARQPSSDDVELPVETIDEHRAAGEDNASLPPAAQPMPDTPAKIKRRHSWSGVSRTVSWNRLVEVYTIPARECAQDLPSSAPPSGRSPTSPSDTRP